MIYIYIYIYMYRAAIVRDRYALVVAPLCQETSASSYKFFLHPTEIVVAHLIVTELKTASVSFGLRAKGTLDTMNGIAKELLFFLPLFKSQLLSSCIPGLFSFKCWGKACRRTHLQLHYTCKIGCSFCASHRSAVDQDLERIGIAISTIPLHLLSFGASPLQVGLVARQFHGSGQAVWWESGNILELLPWHVLWPLLELLGSWRLGVGHPSLWKQYTIPRSYVAAIPMEIWDGEVNSILLD